MQILGKGRGLRRLVISGLNLSVARHFSSDNGTWHISGGFDEYSVAVSRKSSTQPQPDLGELSRRHSISRIITMATIMAGDKLSFAAETLMELVADGF